MKCVPNQVLVFLGIVNGIALAFGLLIGLTGGQKSLFAGFGVLAMFFPLLAMLLTRFTTGRLVNYSPGWRRFSLPYALLAVTLIPLTLHGAMLPTAYTLENGLPWQDWLTPTADNRFHVPEPRAWGTLTHDELILRIALSAGVGLMIVSFLAFFEEIAWRAWLIPCLSTRMPPRCAVACVASLWAFWHTPFVISGLHHFDAIPVTVASVIMLVGQFGAGLVIGWLWLKTESIWVVTLAHGALNNWGQYAFKFMRDIGSHEGWVLLAGNLALLTVGSFLLIQGSIKNHSPSRQIA
jgi:membrane protease YdiL (CAAX protease family)